MRSVESAQRGQRLCRILVENCYSVECSLRGVSKFYFIYIYIFFVDGVGIKSESEKTFYGNNNIGEGNYGKSCY